MKKIVHRFYDKPWKHGILAAICFVLSYSLASWGLDSGRLTAYFLSIVFLVLGVKQTAKAIKMEQKLRTK